MFATKVARGIFSTVARCSGSQITSAPLVVCSTQSRTKCTLPDLPYDYNALEPYISADIMQLHHSKHHQTYVNNYNLAEEQLAEAVEKGETSKIISLQGSLKFNGGGHLNHSIFWQNLSPNGGGEPSGTLADMIKSQFGSFDVFTKEFATKTVAIQGSGWGWLGFNKDKNRLEIATCANQDPLLATTGLHPLLGIDVWEHAYYLQYKNVRPDYVNALFNIVNWKDAEGRLAEAMK
ncbi:superoxide dismutase [Mn], mitochondrial-like [Convolutriloba macropyga]|uniref:superoxide dismutase [Mn], mitochondrial-like n=1 Tax=Convolutriloba macropyga TaxID=536237 RepID=UPI003F51D652